MGSLALTLSLNRRHHRLETQGEILVQSIENKPLTNDLVCLTSSVFFLN